MILALLLLLLSSTVSDGIHFNGGSIRWEPENPYSNSTSVAVAIIQSYSWTSPSITCATNVPISTVGRSGANANLTCVVDCSTDGGYSTQSVNILTDCVSVSSSLGIMVSQRAVNITLAAGAHFYISYRGSAWLALNNPPKSSLYWSILSFIDLRMRPDGFINTPPVAIVASPQYAIVNRTAQIQIPVSDSNINDDIRCRWSVNTPGYRRRRQWNEVEDLHRSTTDLMYEKRNIDGKVIHIRKKRALSCNNAACTSVCGYRCDCRCPVCTGTTCNGPKCLMNPICGIGTTGSTTTETPGTLPTTVSYPSRQAIDECGGICYPNSVPNGTALSNCILSFKGLVPNTWYAIAIQVEDFINRTSTVPLSSVPVQFLIYVMPEPNCALAPTIIPMAGCLEVTTGVLMNFSLYAFHACNPNFTDISDIVVSTRISGMAVGNLTASPTNASVFYVTLTWTPQINQLGPQQLCAIAYTDEPVQSTQYCVTFIVTTSVALCTTTSTSISTSTITTVTTSTTSTTSITSATTTTVTTTSTKSSISSSSLTSTINTSPSPNNIPLVLGLSLGLGIPLLLVLSALATCLCCRWCPGLFLSKLRQRFCGQKKVYCKLCREQCTGHLSKTSSEISDNDSGQYRRQYINENSRPPTKQPFYRDSVLSDPLSPFDMPSIASTRTTLMSSHSISVMPSDDILMQVKHSSRSLYPSDGSSILVQAYTRQEQIRDRFSC